MVETFGIALCQVFSKDIVARRRESVAAHSAVVGGFVRSLSRRRESHDDVAGTDVGIVDDVASFHATSHRAIYNNRAHQVAHIGSFPAGCVDAHTHFAQLREQLVRAVDDGTDHLAGNEHFVAANGRRHQDIVDRSDTQQIVCVHNEGILRDSFPHRQVAGLFPVEIGQTRLGSGAVGVHNVAIVGVAAEDVGNDFTESLRKQSFVDVADGCVHIFFHCAHAAHHVSLILVHGLGGGEKEKPFDELKY